MRYHMVRTDDMLNGDGLRVVLFVSGCSHRCFGCHNPETWDKDSGIEYTASTTDMILEQLGKDYISGLTLSGGDPLYLSNLNAINLLIDAVKERFPEKTIWLYTGYTWENIINPTVYEWTTQGELDVMFKRMNIVCKCDVVVDGVFKGSLADVNAPWVGSTNQRVIDVNKTLGGKFGETRCCTNPVLYK